MSGYNEEELINICDALNKSNENEEYPHNEIAFIPKKVLLRQADLINYLVLKTSKLDEMLNIYRRDKFPKVFVGSEEIVQPGITGPRVGDEHLSRDTSTDILRAKERSNNG